MPKRIWFLWKLLLRLAGIIWEIWVWQKKWSTATCKLINGGVFAYPLDSKSPQGRLRLVYEAYPMAYIMLGAGGMSSDGVTCLLDTIFPLENLIHMKTPIFVGSEQEMKLLLEYF